MKRNILLLLSMLLISILSYSQVRSCSSDCKDFIVNTKLNKSSEGVQSVSFNIKVTTTLYAVAFSLFYQKTSGDWALLNSDIYAVNGREFNGENWIGKDATGKYIIYYACADQRDNCPERYEDWKAIDKQYVNNHMKNSTPKMKPILDNGQCITVVKKYDKACGNNSDIVATIKVVCTGSPLDGKVFIEKKDGTWSSGYFNDLTAGKTQDFWTCNSTGKVIVFRAKHGTVTLSDYPSEQEIKEQFGTKKYGYGEH